MATGKDAGKAAGGVLRDPKTPKKDKTAAASDLAQVPDKSRKGSDAKKKK